MEIDLALEHFRHNHRAVLATRRRDGRPQLSPVLQAVTDDGRIVVSTRAVAMKARNARRDPEVSICAINDGFFGPWVQVDGTATIIELPQAMPVLRSYYLQISGEHPDWDEYERAMVAEGRVVIAIAPVSAGPDAAG